MHYILYLVLFFSTASFAYKFEICCRWDERSSVATPDEEVFYLVALLRTAVPDSAEPSQRLEYLSEQNERVLEFCNDNGIEVKQYLPNYSTRSDWERHFGDKWGRFLRRKAEFDPKHILGSGQGIFRPSSSSSSAYSL